MLLAPGFDLLPNLITNPAEGIEDFPFSAGNCGGILEGPMKARCIAGKNGTPLGGVVADRYHIVKLPSIVLRKMTRLVIRDINANFSHYSYREGVDPFRLQSGRGHFAVAFEEMAGKSLSHLRAAGVAGAQD